MASPANPSTSHKWWHSPGPSTVATVDSAHERSLGTRSPNPDWSPSSGSATRASWTSEPDQVASIDRMDDGIGHSPRATDHEPSHQGRFD